MVVDFHIHSTASDGTLHPSHLVHQAAEGGFSAIALTDHDNADGAKEFLETAASSCVRAIAGIELSIDPGLGFDRFHLLGLGIDPSNLALQALLQEILNGRNERNQKIIENFNRLGIPIEPIPHGKVLARPHFARWLVEKGVTKTISEAFDKYLLPDSPRETRCYEERYHPAQETVFKAVHEAGGVCVMAHPKYWRSVWRETGPDYDMAQRELCCLKEKGLDGLEALYQANTQEENVEFSRIAAYAGLLASAGSDFHGSNKPTIPLGMTVSDSFILPLLERLNLI